MGLSLSVQVVRAGQPPTVHHFDSDQHRTIKIGRLSSAQLKLDDPSVSRIHAVIEFSGNEPSIIDMGSTTGTLVNGARVQKVKVQSGDQIQIGQTMLSIALG